MGALPVHHTDTVDVPWDGPGAEANMRLGADEAYYRSGFAWQDPDANPETKAAYKFIHHMVSDSGDIGAANTTACTTGVGVLNGGMMGTTIPDSDREGVYRHLAAHLKDAGRTPPELRSNAPKERMPMNEGRQQRILPFSNLHIRAKSDGSSPVIAGYAAVFDQPSEVLSDWFSTFREIVMPGAFTKTIKDGADVRALVNHDPNFVLGRVKSGTLSLREDAHGLWMEIAPPDTQWARDLVETMRRGDVDQCSFGFMPIKDRWGSVKMESGEEMDMHYLMEARLFDVSVVTFPAYPQTEVGIRSLLSENGFDLDALAHAIMRAKRGLSLSERDLSVLSGTVERLNSYIPTAADEPSSSGHSAINDSEPTSSSHSLDVDWSQLERLERLIAKENQNGPQRTAGRT